MGLFVRERKVEDFWWGPVIFSLTHQKLIFSFWRENMVKAWCQLMLLKYPQLLTSLNYPSNNLFYLHHTIHISFLLSFATCLQFAQLSTYMSLTLVFYSCFFGFNWMRIFIYLFTSILFLAWFFFCCLLNLGDCLFFFLVSCLPLFLFLFFNWPSFFNKGIWANLYKLFFFFFSFLNFFTFNQT